MRPLKAQVKKGRLVLDVPTDLPDGQVVELLPVEDLTDGMDDSERAELLEELEASLADAKAGNVVPASEVLEHLRSIR